MVPSSIRSSDKMAEAEAMTKKHREIFRKHRVELEENLQPLKLLGHLTRVLSPEDEENVKAERTTTEQARCLLDLLPRRGDQAFEVFVRGLEKTQRFLAIPIAKEGDIELSEMKDGYNGHCMNPQHKELLRSNKEVLKQIDLKTILSLMEVIFDHEDVEDINSKDTAVAKFDEFLAILGKKEDKAFHHFVKILKITNPDISKFLMKEIKSSNASEEKELPNSTQVYNPEDDTDISKVKDKLISFCQKTNENEGWKSLAQHFEVLPDQVGNSTNPTYDVLQRLQNNKVGDLKQALTYLGMTANAECLRSDLMKRTDATDYPAHSPVDTPTINALVVKTQNMSIAEYEKPKLVKTFGDLSIEIQDKLLAEIEAERSEIHCKIPIPPDGERQKYRIREMTKLLRKNKMVKTITWMKNNLQKGVTGPFLDENMNVRDVTYSKRSKLTVELCANDNSWKQLASHLGLSNAEIQYFDSHRFRNPADEVLKQWETKRNTTVGDLYDILVELNMPVIADLTL